MQLAILGSVLTTKGAVRLHASTRSAATVLPTMTTAEMLEVTKIYSVAGMLPPGQPLIRHRPFRAPHHTVSHAGLVGGGRIPRPGEITLAHRDVLFLDELPEYSSQALETLRQPLEDRVVTITRVSGSLSFPANFTLIAAQNPCPYGMFGVHSQMDRPQFPKMVEPVEKLGSACPGTNIAPILAVEKSGLTPESAPRETQSALIAGLREFFNRLVRL